MDAAAAAAAQARIAELEARVQQLSSRLTAATAAAASSAAPSTLRLGDIAPDFDAVTQYGRFNLYEFMAGQWTVLFSHPADFTPVCTTELARAAQLQPELTRRNVRICALSVDSVEHHIQWIADIEAINATRLSYPIIADTDRKVAILYNMLQHEARGQGEQPEPAAAPQPPSLPLTVRSVHIIGSDRRIKAMILYPASTGRSFDEILRVIDSLQLSEKYRIATPCEWKYGDSCMLLPSVSEQDAQQLFPKGVTIVRPWLRITPFPE